MNPLVKYAAALFFAFLIAGSCFAAGTDWSFFKAVSGFDGSWTTEEGTAVVEIIGSKIKISVYKEAVPLGSTDGKTIRWAAESIDGNVDAMGDITATYTIAGTDAKPTQISGHIYSQTSPLTGEKQILFQRIIFSNSYMMFGFSHREIQKK